MITSKHRTPRRSRPSRGKQLKHCCAISGNSPGCKVFDSRPTTACRGHGGPKIFGRWVIIKLKAPAVPCDFNRNMVRLIPAVIRMGPTYNFGLNCRQAVMPPPSCAKLLSRRHNSQMVRFKGEEFLRERGVCAEIRGRFGMMLFCIMP